MPYTNSAHDQNADDNGRAEDEGAVRRMYETAPYPDRSRIRAGLDNGGSRPS